MVWSYLFFFSLFSTYTPKKKNKKKKQKIICILYPLADYPSIRIRNSLSQSTCLARRISLSLVELYHFCPPHFFFFFVFFSFCERQRHSVTYVLKKVLRACLSRAKLHICAREESKSVCRSEKSKRAGIYKRKKCGFYTPARSVCCK